jgi:branched-chain amino acid transport system ATP-binding protein
MLLETENLVKEFGAVVATDGITTSFEEGKLHAIIGPNGAGKTTFFNLLSGKLKPTSGEIFFKEERITDLDPEEIAQRHMIRSYQVTNVFESLSVLENVRVSVQAQNTIFNFWSDTEDMAELVDEAERILDRVELLHKSEAKAGNLSHGEQRTLELAIALGGQPDLLLLDEPTSGMSSEETADMIDLIQELNEETTIILVEHKMSVVMEVADHIKVLHNGRILSEGTPEEIRSDEEVQRVYLQGGQA